MLWEQAGDWRRPARQCHPSPSQIGPWSEGAPYGHDCTAPPIAAPGRSSTSSSGSPSTTRSGVTADRHDSGASAWWAPRIGGVAEYGGDQRGTVGHFELAHARTKARFHRLGADAELGGDLTVGPALRHLGDDLPFTGGEPHPGRMLQRLASQPPHEGVDLPPLRPVHRGRDVHKFRADADEPPALGHARYRIPICTVVARNPAADGEPQALQASVEDRVLRQVPLERAYDGHHVDDDVVAEDVLAAQPGHDHTPGASRNLDRHGQRGTDLLAAHRGVVVVRDAARAAVVRDLYRLAEKRRLAAQPRADGDSQVAQAIGGDSDELVDDVV